MTPLPAALGGNELVAWRLDAAIHASTWASGEGAFLHGGRWNSKGVRAVYCSIDPATRPRDRSCAGEFISKLGEVGLRSTVTGPTNSVSFRFNTTRFISRSLRCCRWPPSIQIVDAHLMCPFDKAD